MSNVEVTGYWNTKKVCEYFGGITARTLSRWKEKVSDPFPSPAHAGHGAKSLYKVEEVLAWDSRNKRG